MKEMNIIPMHIIKKEGIFYDETHKVALDLKIIQMME